MYIAPNSIVYVLSGVPLDNTYEHTIYFDSKTSQQSWFSSKRKYTFERCTYLRKERVIRVEVNPDNLYDCNYIMFQNTNFGSKWFYAFITNVEYIANTTAEISYEIDAMQTWFFDYSLKPCFVEREHSASDVIGENLQPENLETGDYIFRDFIGTNKIRNYKIVVASTFDEDYEDVVGDYYSGIYSGLKYNVFDDADGVNDFISGSGSKTDGIVSVFMMPSDFIADSSLNPVYFDIDNIEKNLEDIDGYVPNNNKLFTYPYNFLYVTNLNGVSAEFPYEYFSGGKCTFGLVGDMSCNPQILLYPRNYKGISANYNEKMVLDGFPQCTYVTDTFKAWLAQSAVPSVLNAESSVLTMAAGLAAGGLTVAGLPVTTIAGAIGVARVLTSVAQHEAMPNHAKNTQGNSASVAMKIKDFAFMHTTIRAEYAKIIDDFWTRYGYPCKITKVPNRNVRAHWTYTKTIDCNITGNIPTKDIAKIKNVYNNGITFWRNGGEIGNFGLENNILNEEV